MRALKSNAREDSLDELAAPANLRPPDEGRSATQPVVEGLAHAGVDLQTAMMLSGATDPKTHGRYLKNTGKAGQIPEAALPKLGIAHAQLPAAQNENGSFSGGRSRDRTCDFVRVKDALYR